MSLQKVIVIFLLAIAFQAEAEDKPAAKPVMRVQSGKVNKPKGENLLDFEAEVIEGEKKRPELFLDIKAGDGNVGSGLYMRPNYDDFFVVDKKRRPRFVKSK